MKHLPILLYILGILAGILGVYKYWFVYSDLFKTILSIGLCLGFCWVAYLFNWMQYKDMKINSLDNRIDSLTIALKDRDLIKTEDLVIK